RNLGNAEPWGRQVEKLLKDTDHKIRQLDQQSKNDMRYRAGQSESVAEQIRNIDAQQSQILQLLASFAEQTNQVTLLYQIVALQDDDETEEWDDDGKGDWEEYPT